MQASYTPQLSYGYYSPYIASVLDIAVILDSFHTAQYQYIPALASPHGKNLQLTLNTAPSFHNPKSVLVVALPAGSNARSCRRLHAVDPKEIYCARKTVLVLPVEGAPLVFFHRIRPRHDIELDRRRRQDARSAGARGTPLEAASWSIPRSLGGAALGDSADARRLRGYWGFDAYRGPNFQLRNASAPRPGSWRQATRQRSSWDGKTTVHLPRHDSVSCVDTIMMKDPAGKEFEDRLEAARAR